MSSALGIAFQSVHKQRRGQPVLDGLTLTVAPGEVVGLLGENGAGKSTALAIAAGLVRPGSGRVLLDGHNAELPASRRQLGYLPERISFRRGLSPRQLLTQRVPADDAQVEEALRQAQLGGLAATAIPSLSRGQRQRVLWAQALLGSPRWLLLDEPFSGLDRKGRQHFAGRVRALAEQGCAVLMTSHRDEDLDSLGARRIELTVGRTQ